VALLDPFGADMIQTVEAVIEPDGTVRLLQPLRVDEPRRALLTILPSHLTTDEVTLLSEPALADWNRPEEDEAWSYLNQGK
jgi:hypothetical protein